MTADDFRGLVLEMQWAAEGAHMGHPDFRANGRIFASLHTHDRFGMVKLTPAEQKEVLKMAPGSFEPSAGAWGRQGCTNVILAAAEVRTVRAAVQLAYEGVMSLPRRPARAKPAASKRSAPKRKPKRRVGVKKRKN
jgi:hypothetical protein